MNKIFALVVGLFVLLVGGVIVYMMAGEKFGGVSAPKRYLEAFAAEYTAAWNSRDPSLVAGFYAVDGSLQVDDGAPAVGRNAIADAAASFIAALPDADVRFDGLDVDGDRAVYRWAVTAIGSGADGGNVVRFSGYEEWTVGADGLIHRSRRHVDADGHGRRELPGMADTRGQ